MESPSLPVLHDLPGWSPYQQHTSNAWLIESPMAAMLFGKGGASARAEGARTSASAVATTAAHPTTRDLDRISPPPFVPEPHPRARFERVNHSRQTAANSPPSFEEAEVGSTRSSDRAIPR